MTFVYPLLLGGLLLAGLPVVLHFLIRRKPKTLPFPAFRFLMQKQRSNTRNLRLRHLLLLLLRVGLLVLVCLALARPRLFHDQIGLSRERPVVLVLVFDTSPSMEYKSGEMTRLELAKKRCLELLDQLPDDCRILIIDSAEPGRRARTEWLRSLDKARQRVKGLTIRANNGPITQAIDEAIRRVEDWDRKDEDPIGAGLPRFLCAFSDRTRACWDVGTSAKLQSAATRDEGVKMRILFFDVGIDEPIDLAITQVELPPARPGEMRQKFAEGEKIVLRAAVQATGKGIDSTMICQVGTRKLQQAFNLQAGEKRTLTFEIDSAEWGLQPGLHQAEVKLETATDALPFNNQRFVTFAIRDRPRILVLVDDAKKARRLTSALRALLFPVDVRVVDDMSEIVLDGHAAVFLDGVAAPPEKLWRSLAIFIANGGGVAIVPSGDDLKHDAYNQESAQQVMPATIGKKIAPAPGPGSTWNLIEADLRHPFLVPYADWLEHGSIDFLRRPCSAFHYWDVKPHDDKDVIVRYDDDKSRPAIVERPGKGKVLLLTTPLEANKPEWTNYHESITSFYVALTMLCTRHLVNETDNPALNHRIGQEPPVTRPTAALAFPKYLLTGPGFSEEVRFDDKRQRIGEHLPNAGNYTLAGVDGDKQQALAQFSVNIPGDESDLTRIPPSEIETVLGKDSIVPQDRRTSLLDSLQSHWSEPVELFPWLMLLVLFFLALENLLANRFYRHEPETQG